MTLKNLAIFAAVAAVLYWLYKRRKAATAAPATFEAAIDSGFGADTNTFTDSPGKGVIAISNYSGTVTPAPTPTNFDNVITYTNTYGYV